MYVSGRVRREGVVDGFPWLGDPKSRGIELVDATQVEHPIRSRVQAVRRARQVLVDTAETTTVPVLLEASVEAIRDYALPRGLEVGPGKFPGLVQSFLRGGHIYAVFAGHSGDPLLSALRPLAGLHVRVHDRAGRAILYGQRPHTPGFALVQGGQNSHPLRPYDRLRIV